MALRHVSVLEGACCGGGSHTKDEAAALRLAPKLNLIHLRRQRLAGSEPMAIEDVVLPPSFSWLLDLDLANGSLHQAPTDHGYSPTRATGTQVDTLADAGDAAFLDLPVGAALSSNVGWSLPRTTYPSKAPNPATPVPASSSTSNSPNSWIAV
jgi:hypothetical protein